MSRFSEYKSTHDAVMSLPFIKDLIESNKRLKKENRALKYLMFSSDYCSNKRDCKCISKCDESDKKNVVIKEEKVEKVKEVVEIIDEDDEEIEKLNEMMEKMRIENVKDKHEEEIVKITNMMEKLSIEKNKDISKENVQMEIIEKMEEDVV